jgi:predicted DNA-binding protein (MmcQ/YjbR family)
LGPGLRRDDSIMNITKAHDFCAKLPGSTRDIKWAFGDSAHAVFSVGSKMFAMFTLKNDKLIDTLMFKADDARFLELTDREGFMPAPYLAKSHWVKVEGVKRMTDTEAKVLLTEAHHVVMAKLSKKMQKAIIEGIRR